MNKRFLLAISIVPLLSLNACTSMQKSPAPQSNSMATPSINDRGNLLEFIDQFNKLSADNQKKELQKINQLRANNPEDIVLRAHSAIVYSLPTSRLKDTGKAQILLDELLADKSLPTDYRYLLNLLQDFNAESSKAAAKANLEQKRADTLQQKAEAAQQKLDALQKKLDDLKTIEKTMIDRDTGLPK